MKVSVISPTGNRLNYLKACIESVSMSVLSDQELEYEHIIIANGDDGQTQKWMAENKPDFVKFINVDEKLKPGHARNLGIKEASGEWIIILDDDDIMLQRTLYHFGKATKANDAQWYISEFVKVNEELAYMPGEDYYGWQFNSAEDMLGAIFRSESFVQGNVCFHKTLFDKVGGYDEERQTAEDLELYCRFLLQGENPKVLPFISHLHRIHTQNTSRGIDQNHHHNDLRQIYKKLEKQLQAVNVALGIDQH